jgi:hypothetical protein
MIDLVVHAGTKFALEQWLAARGLGNQIQDTEPTSPTFGQWFYSHTYPGHFIWWRHPEGKLAATANTVYSGFYGILRFADTMPASFETWVRNNTAVSVLEGFSGYGGEGITLLSPEDINAHLDNIGMPRHEFVGGCEWSDPAIWWLSPVMIGDEREYDGQIWESLIDFNVWSPTQYPEGWLLVGDAEPAILPWVQPTGAQDAYPLNALVTFNGQTWKNTGSAANVWQPGVFGWVVV